MLGKFCKYRWPPAKPYRGARCHNRARHCLGPKREQRTFGHRGERLDRLRGRGVLQHRRPAARNIAALDATTGLATAWNADTNYRVLSLALSGRRFMPAVISPRLAGKLGIASRPWISPVDLLPLEPERGRPFLFPSVNAVAVSGDTVFAGGNFTTVGELRILTSPASKP